MSRALRRIRKELKGGRLDFICVHVSSANRVIIPILRAYTNRVIRSLDGGKETLPRMFVYNTIVVYIFPGEVREDSKCERIFL